MILILKSKSLSVTLEKFFIFFYGFSFLFVRHEPAIFDVISAFLFVVYYKKILILFKNPFIIFFFISQLLSFFLELLLIGTFYWSLISIYLFFLMTIFINFGKKNLIIVFILGAFFSATLTFFSYFAFPEKVIYGEGRLIGFFKDPNVLGPTLLGLGFLSLKFFKFLSLVFIITGLLSLSRATIIASIFAYLLKWILDSSFFIRVFTFSGLILIAIYFYEATNYIFNEIGRGGLINPYDYDRLRNWFELASIWFENGYALGPGWSEINGYAVHSTYLRFLFEQGFFSLCAFLALVFYALFKARTCIWTFVALVFVLVNATFIDGTHWRILFMLIGVALSVPQYYYPRNLAGASFTQ